MCSSIIRNFVTALQINKQKLLCFCAGGCSDSNVAPVRCTSICISESTPESTKSVPPIILRAYSYYRAYCPWVNSTNNEFLSDTVVSVGMQMACKMDHLTRDRRKMQTCLVSGCRQINWNKKLCYRRRTARRAMSVKMLSTVETSCMTNPQEIEWS